MKKIAIIGTGISGLASAYLLKDKYEITIYEKNNYYGGHSRSLIVEDDVSVDTGFIVFNYETYHNLISFFKHLNIPIAKSNMSFGVSINNGEIEYGSGGFKNLIAQKSNLFNPCFYKMIRDIFKFNKISKLHLENNTLNEEISLEQYLSKMNVGKWFKDYYLLSLGACIWSTPLKKMYDFPALSFIRFFSNHGLLTTTGPIQWYTVKGGSKMYVDKTVKELKKSNIKFKLAAIKINRSEKISITDINNDVVDYDNVIFACHSNEVLQLLEKPTDDEKSFLGDIKYQPNSVILHTDETIMPKRKNAWSSWNYLSKDLDDTSKTVSLSYWMNNLQPLDTKKDYFVTVNPEIKPKKSKIINEHIFSHPIFDKKAIKAQKQIELIQGQNNTYFCGAYLRYGFHEDGIFSAVKLAEKLSVKIPW